MGDEDPLMMCSLTESPPLRKAARPQDGHWAAAGHKGCITLTRKGLIKTVCGKISPGSIIAYAVFSPKSYQIPEGFTALTAGQHSAGIMRKYVWHQIQISFSCCN